MDLHLEPKQINSASAMGSLKDVIPLNTHPATEGICTSSSDLSLFYRKIEEEPSGMPCPNVLPCSTKKTIPFHLLRPFFWNRPREKKLISSWLHIVVCRRVPRARAGYTRGGRRVRRARVDGFFFQNRTLPVSYPCPSRVHGYGYGGYGYG
jgi:hypothetical protein